MDNVELRLLLRELGDQCSSSGNDLLDIEVMLQTQIGRSLVQLIPLLILDNVHTRIFSIITEIPFYVDTQKSCDPLSWEYLEGC